MAETTVSNAGMSAGPDTLARLQGEVQAALDLLDFAVATGREIAEDVLRDLKKAQGWLVEPLATLPPFEERATFERAYNRLALALAPVTAATLRATSDAAGRPFFLAWPGQKLAEAKIWSRKLWVWTLLFVLFAIFAENLDRLLAQFFPADKETGATVLRWQMVSFVLQSIVPFTYGGIGACVYLLRSCHEHMYKRKFDPNYIPEYYNHMLLGFVSGGTIMLFVQEIGTREGAIHLSGAALGFLAGYNTEFLFTAIERVAGAILPKIGIETVRRAPMAPVSLDNLLERYQRETDPDKKKALEALLTKMKDRL